MLFKDVAHLYAPFIAKVSNGMPYDVVGVRRVGSEVYWSDKWGYSINTYNMRPILTPLCGLQLSVLEEVIKVKYPDAINIAYVDTPDREGAILRFATPDREMSELSPEQFTILLKAGADLFNLIESGEAINSKTITP